MCLVEEVEMAESGAIGGGLQKDEYGPDYRSHLLEQYKIYVEMADRVSQRREQSNRFYIALLSGLAAILALVADSGPFVGAQAFIFLVAGSVGALMCGVWLVNIRSYRQLNTGKFQVIHEMEQRLPFPSYEREWQILRPPAGSKNYLQLTRVEQIVPWVLMAPYLSLTGYSVYALIYG